MHVTAVRAINVTYRGGNPCNFQAGEARLYAVDLAVRHKNGTNLAKTAAAKVSATTAASATYVVAKAVDSSNSSYYASLEMTWLQWWVA